MVSRLLLCSLFWTACIPFVTPCFAEPTQIDVRVISKGAKFVGTSMGGVAVTIRDAETGEILAQGVTAGSTGDTARIMIDKAPYHRPLSTADAAVFRATLDIQEPRRIEVTARGPLGQLQAIATTSATQWIVPGKPITGGDGFRLELPGFAVAVLAPPAHTSLQDERSVELRANVVMMCGCPVEPGGLWDADRFEVAALIYRDGKRVGRIPMKYAGQTSQFAATLEVDAPGDYQVTIYAYDPENGNTGLDKTTFRVAP